MSCVVSKFCNKHQSFGLFTISLPNSSFLYTQDNIICDFVFICGLEGKLKFRTFNMYKEMLHAAYVILNQTLNLNKHEQYKQYKNNTIPTVNKQAVFNAFITTAPIKYYCPKSDCQSYDSNLGKSEMSTINCNTTVMSQLISFIFNFDATQIYKN